MSTDFQPSAEALAYQNGRTIEQLQSQGFDVFFFGYLDGETNGVPVVSMFVRKRGTCFVAEAAFYWLGLTPEEIELKKRCYLKYLHWQCGQVFRMNDQQCEGR